MIEFEKALGNWIQVVDDKNTITLDDYGYDTGIIEGTTENHCVKCVAVNQCWFKNERGKKPETMNYSLDDIVDGLSKGLTLGLYHYRCHCKEIPIQPNDISEIQMIVPFGKTQYLYESKSGWLEAMGYHNGEYDAFVNVLLQKTKEAYFYGKYLIQNISRYGCKINIFVDIPGANEKEGKTYKLKTNYMVFPNGKIKMNTPIGGWQE